MIVRSGSGIKCKIELSNQKCRLSNRTEQRKMWNGSRLSNESGELSGEERTVACISWALVRLGGR